MDLRADALRPQSALLDEPCPKRLGQPRREPATEPASGARRSAASSPASRPIAAKQQLARSLAGRHEPRGAVAKRERRSRAREADRGFTPVHGRPQAARARRASRTARSTPPVAPDPSGSGMIAQIKLADRLRDRVHGRRSDAGRGVFPRRSRAPHRRGKLPPGIARRGLRRRGVVLADRAPAAALAFAGAARASPATADCSSACPSADSADSPSMYAKIDSASRYSVVGLEFRSDPPPPRTGAMRRAPRGGRRSAASRGSDRSASPRAPERRRRPDALHRPRPRSRQKHAVKRLLDTGPDSVPNSPSSGRCVGGHGSHRVDHLVGDLGQYRAQHRRHLGR